MSVLTPGGVFQETTNLLKNGAPVVTGSDSSGQNLTLHSNNSMVKGTVLLDENTPAYGTNTGALQAIGGISSQHNIVAGGALVNSAYGFSVTNIVVPSGFGGIYNAAVTPAGPTTPIITIAQPTLQGGIQARAIAVMSAGAVVGVTILDPGTGYTVPPLVTFQDPSVQTASFWLSGATVALNTYVKAVQTATGQQFYYQVTVAGTFSATAPTHTSGSAANGGATLLYVGTVAQGYSAVGYSGAMLQGAVHEIGCVNQVVITAAGSAYAQAPTITIGAPDLPGGKRAQAMCTISGGAVNTVTVLDAGSGYLTPPTLTFTALSGGGSGATATAVISNPGLKPIVSVMPVAVIPANTYFLDFGLTGSDTVFISSAAASTVYFDNIAAGAAPYVKGFPQGRKITLYFRNSAAGTTVVTFSNLTAGNSSNGSNAYTISATRTVRFDFIVLTQTVTGGVPADVFMTITAQ